MKEVPTRYLSSGRRVYKTANGKFVSYTSRGTRVYRPKVSHITMGTSKYTVKHHHRVYKGGKPVRKYSRGHMAPARISAAKTALARILSRRTMY